MNSLFVAVFADFCVMCAGDLGVSTMDMQSLASDSPPSVGNNRWYRQALLACVWPIRSGYDVLRILLAVVL
jgi:hypothetical protein